MNARSLTHVILFVILLTVSTGCGNFSSPPTAMPTPSNTAVPTFTMISNSTSTPTQTSTETPMPIVEKGSQPAYVDTISQTYRGVEINLSIITDKSMDSFNPRIQRIYINPHFNNYEGENAKVALAHFAALTFYKSWRSRQNPPQPTSDADFKAYLQLWSQAQKSNDPLDWAKVQIDGIWANDLNDGNGYKQQKYIIWPMYTGDPAQVPQEIRAITEIGVVTGRSSKMKNITIIEEEYNFGLGTNLDGNKLYVYVAWGGNPNGPQHTAGWTFTSGLVYSTTWLIKNQGGSNFPVGSMDREVYAVVNHHKNPGDCCFRAALKIDPPTEYENAYNP